ncbi:MAG: F0F1 ATP synthase subunit A [Firmicutes bacterium]|nr:F0F1 ATP synthase subunit A [Bacillota bacterium]
MEAIEFVRTTINGHTFNVETIVVTWLIMLAATIFFIYFRSQMKVAPGKLQAVVEMVVRFFDEQTYSMMGPRGREYTPLILFIFIAVLSFNWIGLLPSDIKVNHLLILMPPTRDVNTTLALAICTFILFNFYGFQKKGLGYFKNFIHPIPDMIKTLPPYLLFMVVFLAPLFLVLNIVEIFARVLSLTIRLFGNVMGDHIILASLILFMFLVLQMAVVAGVVSYALPIFVYLLGIISGAVQAFIFAILTLTYISSAVEEEHEH